MAKEERAGSQTRGGAKGARIERGTRANEGRGLRICHERKMEEEAFGAGAEAIEAKAPV